MRRRGGLVARWVWLIGLAGLCFSAAGQAAALRYCDRNLTLSTDQKDQLFRFGAVIKDELERSGGEIALISRSGLDLSRFQVRYSHAGLSLKASRNAPWSVRQLYYACDEQRPRIFEEGMSAFLLGTNDPALGYVSIVLLPAAEAATLARAALDDATALQLLGSTYSANAYPFARRYQNCNQWVMELLATAWGRMEGRDDARARAQQWLRDKGYAPSVFDVGSPLLMSVAELSPWLHGEDHPVEDRGLGVYRVSMPASIEAFVKAAVPGARRIEFCHTERQVVVHAGWDAIAEGCRPGAADRVIALD